MAHTQKQSVNEIGHESGHKMEEFFYFHRSLICSLHTPSDLHTHTHTNIHTNTHTISALDKMIWCTAWALHIFFSELSLHVDKPQRGMGRNSGAVIKFDTDEKSTRLIKCRQSPALVWCCEIKLLQLNSPTGTSGQGGVIEISASISDTLSSCYGVERKYLSQHLNLCKAQYHL